MKIKLLLTSLILCCCTTLSSDAQQTPFNKFVDHDKLWGAVYTTTVLDDFPNYKLGGTIYSTFKNTLTQAEIFCNEAIDLYSPEKYNKMNEDAQKIMDDYLSSELKKANHFPRPKEKSSG